jgi:hypothetical protein
VLSGVCDCNNLRRCDVVLRDEMRMNFVASLL